MTALNGTLCFSLAGALLFASHLVAVQRDFIAVGLRRSTRSPTPRTAATTSCCSAATPDRCGGHPARQHHGRQHRRGDRAHGPVRAAAQPGRRAVPRGLADARRVPATASTARAATSTGSTPRPTTTRTSTRRRRHPGSTATTEAVEEITGLYDQLLRPDRPARVLQDLVDAVGGVTIKVQERTPIGGVGADRSPAGSSRAANTSTATRRSGTPAAARRPTTTRGWRGRSA